MPLRITITQPGQHQLRIPDLRAREANLRNQINAIDAQHADREHYLTLATDVQAFLATLHHRADTATIEDRQRVLRLLVKDVLIGPDNITVRHRIPVTRHSTHQADTADTEGDHPASYPLRWRLSPLLANLFMHYAFDAWLARSYPGVRFERYCDDAVVHCRSEGQARMMRAAIADRLAECGLELHETKTKIVYCKDDDRRGSYDLS